MGPKSKQIWDKYFEIFNENCDRDRLEFFSDPLIQFLWSRFSSSCAKEINEQLVKQLQEMSAEKADQIIKDILKVEEMTSF